MAADADSKRRSLPSRWRRHSLVKVRRPTWAVRAKQPLIDEALPQGDRDRVGPVAGTESR
jgi:hypothetical protein